MGHQHSKQGKGKIKGKKQSIPRSSGIHHRRNMTREVSCSIPSIYRNQPELSTTKTNSSILNETILPEISRKTSKSINYDNIKTPHVLDEFLMDQRNYDCFVKFLEKQMCLENLLFLETAIVYRVLLSKLLRKYSSKQTPNSVKLSDKNAVNNILLTDTMRFKTDFKYLKKIYKNMGKKLNISGLKHKKKIGQKMCHQHYKMVQNLYMEIYETYVSDDAKFPVNIPFAIAMSLDYYSRNLNKLKFLYDYVVIFDSAINEIWKLLSSIYLFQFKPHVIQEQKNHK